MKTKVSGLVFSMASPLSWELKTGLSIFPVFYILVRNPLGDTLDCLYRVVAWSMHALLRGVFPDKDCEGPPWEPGTWRSKMANPKIADGWVFLFTELIGDWKFF